MRFYVSPDSIFLDKNTVEIKDKNEIHHIRDVMRLKVGAMVDVFDGMGNEFSTSIEEINKGLIIIKILDINSVAGEGLKPSPAITLYQAIPRRNRMDFIVEKGVELGVDSIVPIVTERTVPEIKDSGHKKIERWKDITIAASKQCGRRRLPAISDILDFKSALDDAKEKDLMILATLDKKAKPLKSILRDSRPKDIAVFVGPEGDFSPEEITIAIEYGCRMCSLGPLVLKSDTAALYIISCLTYEYSDQEK